MKQITLLGLGLICATSVMAQNKTITGVVVDKNGETLIGATIKIVGSDKGTLTDLDGKFSLSVSPSARLQVSYVGYISRTISVGNQSSLNIVLQEEQGQLNELVVTGYGGRQRRSKVTNSIAKVSNETLGVGLFANPAQALSGAVSGLRVVQSSGRPGAAPQIILRGGTNFDGSGSPLVVIDGQLRGGLNDINPEDIESMEVLKDAGATAIYGARASNGVILVTTKSGKKGRSAVNLKIKAGFNYFNPQYEFLGAEEYLTRMRTAYSRTGFKLNDGTYHSIAPLGNLTSATPMGTGNDLNQKHPWNVLEYEKGNPQHAELLEKGWQTMVDPLDPKKTILFRDQRPQDFNINSPSFSQDYNLNMEGGNDKGTYYAGLGYNHSEGLPTRSWYKRYSFILNGTYQLKPWLKSISGISYNRANWESMPGSQGDESNYFTRILSTPPTMRFTDEKGNPQLGANVNDGNQGFQPEKWMRDNQTDKFTLNQSFEITPIKDLSIKLFGSWYYSESFSESFTRDYLENMTSGKMNRTRSTSASYNRAFAQTYNAVVNYSLSIGEHTIAPMLGIEYLSDRERGFSASGSGAPTDDFRDLALTSSEEGKRHIDSWDSEMRILSYFGRINYDYQDKYLLSATFRQDGYSSLLGDNRWGFFPGISAGWLFGRESFVQDALPFLSFGKLRFSTGVNGDASGIGRYELQGAYTAYKYNGHSGILLSALPNSGLRWEKTTTMEVGLDLGFLNNRLSANISAYTRLTSDKYASISITESTGYRSIRSNNGELRNQGIELELSARILEGKNWKWSANGNISYGVSHIVKLPDNGLPNNRQGGVQLYTGEPAVMVDGKLQYPKYWAGGWQEGQSTGILIGYVAEGIYKSIEEIPGNLKVTTGNINGKTQYGPQAWSELSVAEQKNKAIPISPGDVKWKDINGDGIIDEFDRVVIGNTIPRWTGGLSSTLSYKEWTLSARADFALGHWIYNNRTPWFLGAMQGTYNTITDVRDTWSPENPNGSLPRYVFADQLMAGNYYRTSTLFAHRGDYLALREVSLSYRLPEAWANKIFCQNISLSVTGQNLGYLTADKYLSTPEAGGSTNGGYPLPRTLLFGLNVTF